MDPTTTRVNANLLSGVTSPRSALENYLFMGNPGTGKSTLINCLAGTPLFNSGLSYGEGLTKEFQKRVHDNIQYMDTPGLADRSIQEKAAAAITEALKQTGTFKLFFMVRLENGRVVSDDLATIEIVLNSIEMEKIPFAVIVNNVKKRQYAQMREKGPDFLRVMTLIHSIEYKAHHIAFIPVIGDLDEEDNAVAKLPAGVERFVRSESPTVQIAPQSVKPIKIEDFKKISEKLRQEQEQLLNDKALMERRVAELTRKSHTVGSVLGKMGELASFVVGSLSFQGENSTDQSEGLYEASLMTGTPPQPTTPPVKLSNRNPDPNATARGEDHNRIAGVAYISDLASAIPVAKTQFSPQIQTMELNHEQSGMKPKQYNQRGHRLPSDAVNPLVDTGITSHDNLSEVPTFNKKVSQVGDPLQHATLDKAPQDPHLDQEGDVIM